MPHYLRDLDEYTDAEIFAAHAQRVECLRINTCFYCGHPRMSCGCTMKPAGSLVGVGSGSASGSTGHTGPP